MDSIKLYGIMQDLGDIKETQIVPPELEKELGSKLSLEKYKAFKPKESQGGVRLFKGFAESKLLAEISETKEYYQRKIDEEHKRKFEEYLINSTLDRFYLPEVTLLYEYDSGVDPNKLPFQSIIKEISNKDNTDALAKNLCLRAILFGV